MKLLTQGPSMELYEYIRQQLWITEGAPCLERMDVDNIHLVHQRTADSIAVYPLHQWSDYITQPIWCFFGRSEMIPICACIMADHFDIMDVYVGDQTDDQAINNSLTNATQSMSVFDGSLFRALLLPSQTVCLCEALTWCGYLIPTDIHRNTILAVTMHALTYGKTATDTDSNELTFQSVEWCTSKWLHDHVSKHMAFTNGILVCQDSNEDQMHRLWYLWPMNIGKLLCCESRTDNSHNNNNNNNNTNNKNKIWYGGLRVSHYADITLPRSRECKQRNNSNNDGDVSSTKSSLLAAMASLPTQDIQKCATTLCSDRLHEETTSPDHVQYSDEIVLFHTPSQIHPCPQIFVTNYFTRDSAIWRARQQQYMTTEDWHETIRYLHHFRLWNEYIFSPSSENMTDNQ